MNKRWTVLMTILLILSIGSIALAADDDETAASEGSQAERGGNDRKAAGEKEDKQDAKKEASDEKPSITHGHVQIARDEVTYTATAGKMLMKSDQGEDKAHMFYIAYTRDGDQPATSRPITFCFNGGPGSSSVWLHLGMLGPLRVKTRDDAQPEPPPYQLIANPYSLLDVTDLVFIDPVSTGFSRPAEGEEKSQFHGYQEDLRSVGQFIHDYTTKNERWLSPKFVIGESYGGLRASGLAGELQNRYRMYLNGIVLISAVVDFQTLAFGETNDLPYILFLPSYTATAWYHEALADNLQELSLGEVVRRSERFAMGPYAKALLRGSSLPDDQREQIVRRLARLTGLSEEYVNDSNLRVGMSRFAKELLRDRDRTVGRYDSRFLGIDRDSAGDRFEYDPSGATIFGAFTAAMNDYLRRTLEYKEDRVYEILTGNVRPWSYDRFENRYVSASETLREAMTANPFLKVFAACGYFDLATPEFAMKYTRDHLALAPELAENFEMEFYEGGHMMYIHEPSLEKLRADLLEFYEKALRSAEDEEDEDGELRPAA